MPRVSSAAKFRASASCRKFTTAKVIDDCAQCVTACAFCNMTVNHVPHLASRSSRPLEVSIQGCRQRDGEGAVSRCIT
jgi:hypothetical protein